MGALRGAVPCAPPERLPTSPSPVKEQFNPREIGAAPESIVAAARSIRTDAASSELVWWPKL